MLQGQFALAESQRDLAHPKLPETTQAADLRILQQSVPEKVIPCNLPIRGETQR